MSPDPVNPQVKVSPAAVVPAPSTGTVLPPAGPHKIVFRDRSDAEGVAKIYYSECKTVDLKTGKEASVADLAKKMEKELDMANGRLDAVSDDIIGTVEFFSFKLFGNHRHFTGEVSAGAVSYTHLTPPPSAPV